MECCHPPFPIRDRQVAAEHAHPMTASMAMQRRHILTSTLATRAGASPTEIATRAGHSSVLTVLDRYGHLLPGSGEHVTDARRARVKPASLEIR